MNEMAFVYMWKRYAHCQSSTEVDQMWQDVQQFNKTIHFIVQTYCIALLFTDMIEQILAAPPPRLAVASKAMAAICTLLTGQAAQNAGRARFASEMCSFVRSNFAQPQYAYARAQAHMGLDQLEGNADDRVMMVSTRHTP